jgi:hypothetical protein
MVQFLVLELKMLVELLRLRNWMLAKFLHLPVRMLLFALDVEILMLML